MSLAPILRPGHRNPRAGRRRVPAASLVAAVAIAVLGWPGAPVAQAAPTDTPAAPMDVPNGTVTAVKIRGDVAYLGGQFDQVGPLTGPGVALDAATARDLALPRFSGGSGGVAAVSSVIPDGAGGWYVGGLFSEVGGVARNNAARILADGSVGAWNPNVDGQVSALARSGSTVYLGGTFAGAGAVNGTATRDHAAAVDGTTGAVTAWNPDVDGDVAALAVLGPVVYLGGEFTTVGSAPRSNIAAVSGPAGAVLTDWDADADAPVAALTVSVDTLYAGGAFSNIGGEWRERLAALNVLTGLATGWQADADGDVKALAVAPADGTVYVGGAFEDVGGVERNHAAAISSTGVVRAWDPDVGDEVSGLALSGSTIYLAGGFVTIGGTVRRFLGAVDAATGVPTDWDPRVGAPAYGVAVSGAAVFAGGMFTTVGGVTRRNAAAIDLTSGRVTAWNPDVADGVTALAFSGSTVYIAGSFRGANAINGSLARRYLAAVDDTTGAATSWNPNPDGQVRALEVAGGRLYVGGAFLQVAGQSRDSAAAFDTATGLLTEWDPIARAPAPEPANPPPPPARASITGLDVAGSTVFLAGGFISLGGQTRIGVGAVDATTGAVREWAPMVGGLSSAIATRGSTVYLVGAFTSVNGVPRRNAAAVDATTGAVTPWDPNVSGSPMVVVPTASAVYLAGLFFGADTLNGDADRNTLAAVDPVTGKVTSWNPPVPGAVFAVDATDSLVFAGGVYAFASGAAALFGEPAQVTGPADQAVLAGSAATFAAEVAGAPVPQRQWQASTDGGATFADLPGERGATLTVPATLAQSGWRYRLRAANLIGGAAGPAATLTVSPLPGGDPPGEGRTPPVRTPPVRTPKPPATGVAVVTRTAVSKKGIVRVTLRCAGKKACTGTFRVVATKAKRKPVVATGRYAIKAGRRVTLKLRVSAPARKLLAKRRSTLPTTITLTPKAGRKVTARLTLRSR